MAMLDSPRNKAILAILFAGLLGAHFDLSRSWTLDLEGGYQHLGFEDDQALPNDIDVEFGPFVGLGISAHW